MKGDEGLLFVWYYSQEWVTMHLRRCATINENFRLYITKNKLCVRLRDMEEKTASSLSQ